MTRRARRRPAVTLLETLMAVALVGVVISVTANYFTGFARLLRHSQVKNQQLEIARGGLNTLCVDLEQAHEITPAIDSVSLTRLRAAEVLSDPLPTAFDPQDPSRLETISYLLTDRILHRRNGGDSSIVAEGIDGCSVEKDGRRVTVALTLVGDTKVTTLTREVFWWVAP